MLCCSCGFAEMSLLVGLPRLQMRVCIDCFPGCFERYSVPSDQVGVGAVVVVVDVGALPIVGDFCPFLIVIIDIFAVDASSLVFVGPPPTGVLGFRLTL